MRSTLGLQRRGEASSWPNLKPIEGKKPLTDRDLVTVPSIYSDGDPRHERGGWGAGPGLDLVFDPITNSY